LDTEDDGNIKHYINGETGELQESRRVGHCMLGLGVMSTVCGIAWVQGVDLYSVLNNRLLLGHKYVSKYNLGHYTYNSWETYI
jgi:hypothetical protein